MTFTAPRAAKQDFGVFAPAGERRARQDLLAVTRARRAERVVNDLFGRVRLAPDLTRAVEHLAARAADAPETVEPALTSLGNVDLDHPKLFPAAIVQAAVVRAVVAGSGDVGFSAGLPAPMRLRWRGVLSPPATHVLYDPSAPDKLVVILRSGKALVLDPGHEKCVALPTFALGSRRATLLPGWSLDACSSPWLEVDLEVSTLETPTLVRRAEEAAAFLGEASPAHLDWVADVMFDLYPVDGRDGRLRRSSNTVAPGRVAATFHDAPALLAENLVHEASHLYFQLATELDPLDDGSDDTLHASAPIGELLLAFHASANLAELFEAAIVRGVDDGHCARGLPALRADMETMAGPLRASRALTERGRALVASFL